MFHERQIPHYDTGFSSDRCLHVPGVQQGQKDYMVHPLSINHLSHTRSVGGGGGGVERITAVSGRKADL